MGATQTRASGEHKVKKKKRATGNVPVVWNIEKKTMANRDYRRVIYSSKHMQVVLMNLHPGEDIGTESHPYLDQFIRVESGQAMVEFPGGAFADTPTRKKERKIELNDGAAFVIPAMARHNITNVGDVDLKLYTIYSFPEHDPKTVTPEKRAPTSDQKSKRLATAKHVDLDEYSKKWYEIASFPQKYQAQCQSDTTAEYSLLKSGHLKILNRCRTASGFDTREGRARILPKSKSGAKLEVTFARDSRGWMWERVGDYWILAIDPAYEWALVGTRDRKSLWILASRPQMEKNIFDDITRKAEALNFDVAKLRLTKHTSG